MQVVRRRRRAARSAVPPVPVRGPVLRNGLRLGFVYAVMALLGRVWGDSTAVGLFIRLVGIAAGVGYLMVAGRAVAQSGAKWRRAMFAGALAGGVAWFVDALVVIALYRIWPEYYLQQAIQNAQATAAQTTQMLGQTVTAATITQADATSALVIGLGSDLFFSLAFGALFGAAGWLLVRARSDITRLR